MLDERTADLIHAEIDGELAAPERVELDRLLQASAEARAFREQLQSLDRTLAQAPRVEPPPGLEAAILRSLGQRARQQRLQWLASWFRPVSYGLAVAAGMLLAVGVSGLSPDPAGEQREANSLVGSMILGGDRPATNPGRKIRVQLPELQGDIALKNLDGSWALEFDIQSPDALEVMIDLADTGYSLGGVADQHTNIESLRIQDGQVIVQAKGRQHFALFLRDSAAGAGNRGEQSIEVTWSRAGEPVFNGALLTTAEA